MLLATRSGGFAKNKECRDQRSYIQTKSQLSRHASRKHSDSDVEKMEIESEAPKKKVEISSDFNNIKREKSITYFKAAANNVGSQQLVATAFGQPDWAEHMSLDDRDVIMMMTLSRHVASLTRNQRERALQTSCMKPAKQPAETTRPN